MSTHWAIRKFRHCRAHNKSCPLFCSLPRSRQWHAPAASCNDKYFHILLLYLCSSVFHLYFIICDQIYGSGKKLPLCLLHHPALKELRRIARLYFHCLLQKNGVSVPASTKCTVAPVTFASCQNALMHAQPAIADAAERGSGGMDVDDPVRIRIDDHFGMATKSPPALPDPPGCPEAFQKRLMKFPRLS